jgi:hypothetical protein
MNLNSILPRLREAIDRGKGCPAAPKVSISVEFAREIDQTLVHLAQKQISDEMIRVKFESQCG